MLKLSSQAQCINNGWKYYIFSIDCHCKLDNRWYFFRHRNGIG